MAPMEYADRLDLVIDALGELLAVLYRIDRTLRRIDMSDIPALDAEIANDLAPMVGQAVQALQVLENKLAGAGSPVDVSAEIASLRALHDSLSAAVTAANPAPAPAAPASAANQAVGGGTVTITGTEGVSGVVAPSPSPADVAAQEAQATASNVDTTAPAPVEAAPAGDTGDAGNPPAEQPQP